MMGAAMPGMTKGPKSKGRNRDKQQDHSLRIHDGTSIIDQAMRIE
jgi:hypothetical protein